MRRLLALLLLVGCTPAADSPLPAGLTFGDGPAWVVFTDRAGTPTAPSAATARRARSGITTASFDRPVHSPYIAALRDAGLTVRATSRVLNAVSVESTAGFEADLAALSFVHAVRPVARRQPAPMTLGPAPIRPRDEAPPSPLDYGAGDVAAIQVGADALHGLGFFGAGITVGVADTGFVFDNEVLAPVLPRVLDAWDFLDDDGEVGPEPGDDPVQARHGALVVSVLTADRPGTLVGIAPGVNLLLAKTESVPEEAPFEEDVWIEGLEWLEASGADLVTSSLGWFEWYTVEDLDGATATSSIFAQALVTQAGLPLFVSAGNEGPGASSITTPADAPAVFAVGATTSASTPAAFSGRGPTADGRTKPDVAAFGHEVPIADWDAATGLSTGSGTSFATPIVAGVAALLLEVHPDWSATQLTDALRGTASQSFFPDQALGHGIPDAFAACGLACSCRDTDADGHYALDCGGQDCDDSRPTRFPGAVEQCDGLDTDCDGALPADEQDADADGDLACQSDCDDDDPTRQGLDFDGDGFSLCDGDCADGDPARNPGATDLPYDGIDQDCTGEDLTDVDGDGFDRGDDCDDGDPSIYPDPTPEFGPLPNPLPGTGGHELCADRRDNDCDGRVDGDDPDCDSPSVTPDEDPAGAGCRLAPPGLPLALLLIRRRRRCAA